MNRNDTARLNAIFSDMVRDNGNVLGLEVYNAAIEEMPTVAKDEIWSEIYFMLHGDDESDEEMVDDYAPCIAEYNDEVEWLVTVGGSFRLD